MKSDLEDIFVSAFKKNKDKIYRICCTYSQSHDLANDLFQEVVLNIWESLPSFKGNASINTWIYRITINVCLRQKSFIDKEKKIVKSIDGLETIFFDDVVETNPKLTKLNKCIKQLNEVDKSIVLLFMEDLPYKEIAEITGISENHVAVKMKRIKEKLIRCIEN